MDFKNINWKSKKLWVSITSGLILAGQGIAQAAGQPIVPEQLNNVQVGVNSILALLVGWGVLSDASA